MNSNHKVEVDPSTTAHLTRVGALKDCQPDREWFEESCERSWGYLLRDGQQGPGTGANPEGARWRRRTLLTSSPPSRIRWVLGRQGGRGTVGRRRSLPLDGRTAPSSAGACQGLFETRAGRATLRRRIRRRPGAVICESRCRGPLRKVMPVRRVSAGFAPVPKWHELCSARSPTGRCRRSGQRGSRIEA
jgi:hypothetical protein